MNTRLVIYRNNTGFSLIELAIVLFIVALLLGGLLPTISSQIDQQRTNDTRKQLDEIQQALIGYALINGRLPCPASDLSNGVEMFAPGNDATTGVCSNFYNGFLPATTLGIATGVDGQGRTGFAVDAWNNRIHYAVTSATSRAFTTSNGMKTYFSSPLAPDLQVCSTATGVTGSPPNCASGPPSASLTSGVPAVIYSTGKNGGYGGTGVDETENPNPNSVNNDRLFISHTPTTSSATNGEFDDIVIWISPNILINRMVTAGKLP
jgi:prepilin-type N-terminal cleavage/methylation domain-containing protein